MHRDTWGHTGTHEDTLGHTGTYWDTQGHVGTHGDTRGHTGTCCVFGLTLSSSRRSMVFLASRSLLVSSTISWSIVFLSLSTFRSCERSRIIVLDHLLPQPRQPIRSLRRQEAGLHSDHVGIKFRTDERKLLELIRIVSCRHKRTSRASRLVSLRHFSQII